MDSSGCMVLLQKKVYPSECVLGEGLFIADGTGYWVDIANNYIYRAKGDAFDHYETESKASVIYELFDGKLQVGSDSGLISFCLSTRKETSLLKDSIKHSYDEYRSNDGGFVGDLQLLSYMHRDNPELYPGFIYRVDGGSYQLIDDSIFIPNTFVPLDRFRILISDSLQREVWLYRFNEIGKLIEKVLWAKTDPGEFPDGGCVVGEFVFIALWDGAAIAVFNFDGELVQRISMPVLRPTNCKFDGQSSTIWVTSASDGLSDIQKSEESDSGNTFVFDLKVAS